MRISLCLLVLLPPSCPSFPSCLVLRCLVLSLRTPMSPLLPRRSPSWPVLPGSAPFPARAPLLAAFPVKTALLGTAPLVLLPVVAVLPLRLLPLPAAGQSPGPPPSRSHARLFCPVPSCPDSGPPSHGWATFGSMRPHVDAHLAGQLAGDFPMDWLRRRGFGTCEVCQRVLSLRFNGRCPSCFRAFTSHRDGAFGSSRPLAEGAPGVWEVFSGDRRVHTSVPKGARDSWSRCLISALADVITHRDVKSWTDLLTLPVLLLPAPSRGGGRHVLRHESEVGRRCLDWLSGIRADLWAPPSSRQGKDRASPRLQRKMMESFLLPRWPGVHPYPRSCSSSCLRGVVARPSGSAHGCLSLPASPRASR